MAATTVNVPCGFVNFHKDSEIAHVGPSSLAMRKRFNDRRATCSTTISDRRETCSATIKSGKNNLLLPMSGVEKKGFGDQWGKGGESVVYEKMDEWMKESVAEIVKNLREAPLLVHVYNGGETLRTEKGVEEECWVEAIQKWKRREMPMPEGVIFVEKLEDDDDGEDDQKRKDDGVSRAWGIVVQGRGGECGPLCYLLKTSRGGGGGGLGFCCTHFCLMRVKSFRESARSQLMNCWLH